MTVLDYMKNNLVCLDGGMGTILQKNGLMPGELPERRNITHPEQIIDIHRRYFDAGSNVINTNTFGANCLKFNGSELEDIIKSAVENAKKARELSAGAQPKFIALDIGPLGRLLKPYGDFDFDEAVECYVKTVKIGAKYGADLIFIETMNDSLDTKAAVLASKAYADLPIFVSNAYGEDGKLMTGATPAAMVAMLEGLGVDAVGANCSLGPAQLAGVVKEYLKYSSLPVILKPNAGLPKSVDGQTVYDVKPNEFSNIMMGYVNDGIRIFGGCCGTDPEYISATVQKVKNISPKQISDKNITMVSSYTHAVEFKDSPVLIGERINPTGKKMFKEALRNNDIDYVLNEGLKQQEKGVHILDVNVGLPEIDEKETLKKVCFELQSIIDLPLQIDTSDVQAMEAALRRYNGKPMINSVNGKEESMRAIFPLVKKYGGLVVCLTLDENGIPETAEKRVEIAKKIINTAKAYGISKKDLIFDSLAMTVSADNKSACTALKTLNIIKNELKCHTLLGVSNVSFGLPHRDILNGAFFTLALENGLSAAIMNPDSNEMMKSYYSFKALKGLDRNCADFIENIEKYAPPQFDAVKSAPAEGAAPCAESELQRAIVKGLKEKASAITELLLEKAEPLDIVNSQIIPALDIVGKSFENKTTYLPQLLMSAEAASSAFEKIKLKIKENPSSTVSKGKFVLATVKGDIHDIGKNIVKLIMENYGFEVYDLGKDVPPEKIVAEVLRTKTKLVGLSALMTTTVPAMADTIRLLREKAPDVKVIVGGAVLTQEYADSIGAHFYAKDAMETVRYSLNLVENGESNE